MVVVVAGHIYQKLIFFANEQGPNFLLLNEGGTYTNKVEYGIDDTLQMEEELLYQILV